MSFFKNSRSRKVSLFTGLLLVSIFLPSVLWSTRAGALVHGRDWYRGYFSNRLESTSSAAHGQVIVGGIPAANRTKAGFISFILSNLRGGGRDAIGAAFIIQTMRHQNGAAGLNPPDAAEIADWQARINAASVTVSVGSYNFPHNSAYGRNINDDIYYPDPGTASSLIFRVNGTVAYVLKLDCANVVGGLGLPAANWSLAGSSSAPATAQPGQMVTFTHRVTNTGGSTTPTWYWNLYWMPPTPGYGGETRIPFTGDPPGTTSHASAGLAPGATRVLGYNYTIPAGAVAGSRYCQRVGWDPVNNASPPARNGRSAMACVTVTAPPIWSLSGTSAVSVATAAPGQTVRYTHTITNTGTIATGAWRWNIYWQPPTVPSEARIAFTGDPPGTTSHPGPALATGASRAFPYDFTIPAGATNGSRYCMNIGYDPINNASPPARNGRSAAACVTVVIPPTPPACPVPASSGLSFSPSSREPGQAMSIIMRVVMGAVPPTTPYTMSYTIGPSPNASGSVSVNNSGVSAGAAYTPASAGTYTVRWHFRAADGTVSPNCSATFSVASMPFVSVNGGDVVAGSGMTEPGTPPTCTASNPDASIVSWNRLSGSYNGAGTDYAAFALNHIQSFATNQAAGQPRSLAFANNGSSGANGSDIFGGNFGLYQSCVPNYYYPSAATGTLGSVVTASTLSSGVYQRNGTLTINGGNIANGRHVTIHASGNVYLNGNITFSGGYAAEADIPSFSVVTTGNIYINRTTGQLDGLYVSEPGAGGGTIYTCASGLGAPLDAAANTPANEYISFYNDCNHQLTVNGAFVAARVKLLRTFGTLGNNQPAEVFNYTPELWINRAYLPADPTKPSGTLGAYDSISGLPPVL